MQSDIEKASTFIREAKRMVAFTGAGISEESGIPTYRDTNGLWTKYDPSKYASIDYFLQDPSYYWHFFREVRYPLLFESAQPNPGHLALADLERTGKLRCVITQNIDGLHQEAGSTRVIELHGNTRIIRCLECSKEFTAEKVYEMTETRIPPLCTDCGGLLKPAVVFFGEQLPQDAVHDAYAEAEACDLFLVVGSSLVVYPAAHIPVRAKECGARLVIINKEPTVMDTLADAVLNAKAGTTLPQIIATPAPQRNTPKT
ncbi:MAG: NAD-dependent deacylase [Gemmatimonadota bacterium]|nr:MAG: NAD-dependent deacylase [Gemmatimonadota bacterium]